MRGMEKSGENERIIGGSPAVKLQKYFTNASAHAVAAARTCYSPRVINEDEVTREQKERIGKGCFEGGHHTVFQHATFSFSIENVSRHFVWAFLHSHPFFNSEQSSQRYVKLNEIKATVPPLNSDARRIFEQGLREGWQVYNRLTALLKEEFIRREKEEGKQVDEKREKLIEKKAIELARYAVPVAAHTSMVHTISGLTLARLYYLSRMPPVSWEAALVVDEMVKQVINVDPDFKMFLKDPLNKEELLESSIIHLADGRTDPERVASEFDEDLDGGRVKLIRATEKAEELMADSIRIMLGLTKEAMSDEEALRLVLDPKKNKQLTQTLNISTISPLMRAMYHPVFTFKIKLSHTADSQNQRHRMVFATRPLTLLTISDKPDYIMPEQIKGTGAEEPFRRWMERVWEIRKSLINAGAEKEFADYILPNALSIRIIETSNFMFLWHKWRLRSCLEAQREIWHITIEEIESVREKFPLLVENVGPDCKLRFLGGVRPFCTQPRWCGQPVWTWKDFRNAKRRY